MQMNHKLRGAVCLAAVFGLTAQAAPPTGVVGTGVSDGVIVTLTPGAAAPVDVAADVAAQTGGQVGYVYETVLQGFSLRLPVAACAIVERNPNVASCEPDIAVTTVAQTIPTGVYRSFADFDVLDIDGTDDFRVDVDVAVLDTGIDVDHPDLYVAGGTNCLYTTSNGPFKSSAYCEDSETGDDDNYHGTHVAGTIAALDNGIGVVGIAPGARLWAVKVLDSSGSGTLSGIIAGIDWVVARGDIEVINMSLGGSGQSDAMDKAVADAVAGGVAVVVAAGNSNKDAAGFTPANAPDAITVSALADFDGEAGGLGSPTCRYDQDDTLADFSNWGAVDIAAPGVCILSTYPDGKYNTISGTSMAAPHVAGAAALLASAGNSVADIRSYLLSTGNYDWVDDSGDGVTEPLLDISHSVFTPSLLATGGEETTNSAPTASFTFACTDLVCTFDASGSTDGDGDVLTYSWDLGDGTKGSGEVLDHTYAAAGDYGVSVTVSDGTASDTASQTVSVSTSSDEGDSTASFTTASTSQGRTWTAIVSGDASFTGAWSDNTACSSNTESPYECTVSGIRKNVSSVSLAIDGGPTLTINKP